MGTGAAESGHVLWFLMMTTELEEFPSIYDPGLPTLVEGLLPPGDYAPTQEQFEQRFASTVRRRLILAGWERHKAALRGSGLATKCRELLNGSFTTAKEEPGDLDLAVEVPTTADALMLPSHSIPAFPLLQGPRMKPEYLCDAYPIFRLPANDPLYAPVTVAAIRY